MNTWIALQMSQILNRTSGATIVLDPDGVLCYQDLAAIGESCGVIQVDDWIGLRCAWDLRVRHGSDEAHNLVLVTSSEFVRPTDLPWDIEQDATEVIRLRWPVPVELRALLRVADPTNAENLIRVADKHTDIADILASAYGIVFGNPGQELAGVTRLRLAAETPDELWDALARVLTTPAARVVAVGRGDLAGLQQSWNAWLRDGHGDGADAFVAVPEAVLRLLSAGLLRPAPIQATGLPDWAQIGAADPDPEQVIAELLTVRPSPPTHLVRLDRDCVMVGTSPGSHRHVTHPSKQRPSGLANLGTTRRQVPSLVAQHLRFVAALHNPLRRVAPSHPTASTPR